MHSRAVTRRGWTRPCRTTYLLRARDVLHTSHPPYRGTVGPPWVLYLTEVSRVTHPRSPLQWTRDPSKERCIGTQARTQPGPLICSSKMDGLLYDASTSLKFLALGTLATLIFLRDKASWTQSCFTSTCFTPWTPLFMSMLFTAEASTQCSRVPQESPRSSRPRCTSPRKRLRPVTAAYSSTSPELVAMEP